MKHFGFLNINKPAGISSRQVVNIVQRLVKPQKVGHAGTLDPIASGVVVVAIGQATRLIDYVQAMSKKYCATFLLGQTSPSEDIESEITYLESPPIPTLEQIQAVTKKMVGEIMQRPPAFSALKVNGKRAYKLARRGKEVELKPRPIMVYSIEVKEYEYPRLVLDIHCGRGTYVRSLGRDLAEELSTGAVMLALERTAVGSFQVQNASSIDHQDLEQQIIPAIKAVEQFPQIQFSEEEKTEFQNGRQVPQSEDHQATILKHHNDTTNTNQEFLAIDSEGNFFAIVTPQDNLWQPLKVYVHQE